MKSIPPHITWPLIIVGFLVLGMTWSFGVVIASRSDGGPAVVEDYYEKAISWDQEREKRDQSDAQNWDLSISVNRTVTPPVLTLEILDNDGQPVNGMEGVIYALRPQKAQPVREIPLVPSKLDAGTYTSPFPELSAGIWDFQIDAEKETLVVYTTIRKEF